MLWVFCGVLLVWICLLDVVLLVFTGVVGCFVCLLVWLLCALVFGLVVAIAADIGVLVLVLVCLYRCSWLFALLVDVCLVYDLLCSLLIRRCLIYWVAYVCC